MFRFASPGFLFLLLVPWAWWFFHAGKQWVFRSPGQRKNGLALNVAALDREAPPQSPWLIAAGLLPLCKALAISLMILALARPQAGEQKIRTETEGVNIILALDLSESMSALDFKKDNQIVNRLDAVKSVVSEFIMAREGDRIGMVVFGSQAFTQLPLTRDYNTIAFMLDHLTIGAAGPRTAIGDAIGIAIKRLADIESKTNLIILLTDGKSNAGSLSWQDGAALAAQKGIRIHTIGVGTQGRAPFLVDGFFGQQYVYQPVDIDLDALKAIAGKTGGQFFKAEDTDGLKQIYATISDMEKTKVELDKWVDYREWFARFLVPGLILYLTCLALSQTRLIRIP